MTPTQDTTALVERLKKALALDAQKATDREWSDLLAVAEEARAALSAPHGDVEAMRETIGPSPQKVQLTCKGCPALVTEDWKDYLENDETDRATSARCKAVPDEHGGKSISAYWNSGDNPPKWCPALATPVAEQPQPSGISKDMVPVEQCDRDAANATMWKVCKVVWTGDEVREGKVDHHEYVQAFARHRIAAQPHDQIEALTADNARLREAVQKCGDMLVKHHQWHASQTAPDPEHGFIPADEYGESSLHDQTVETIQQASRALIQTKDSDDEI